MMEVITWSGMRGAPQIGYIKKGSRFMGSNVQRFDDNPATVILMRQKFAWAYELEVFAKIVEFLRKGNKEMRYGDLRVHMGKRGLDMALVNDNGAASLVASQRFEGFDASTKEARIATGRAIIEQWELAILSIVLYYNQE